MARPTQVKVSDSHVDVVHAYLDVQARTSLVDLVCCVLEAFVGLISRTRVLLQGVRLRILGYLIRKMSVKSNQPTT